MRRLLALAALALVPAGASAAPLIGREASTGPYRFLDRDLRVVKGSPRIPQRYSWTLGAPSGKRFAAVRIDEVRVYGTRRRTTAFKSLAFPTWWVSRHHMLLFGGIEAKPGIESLDLRTGRVHKAPRLDGDIDGAEVAGGRLHVVLRDDAGANYRYRYAELGRTGRLRQAYPIPLPAELTDPTVGTEVSLSGNRVVVSGATESRLVQLGPTRSRVLDLPLGPGYWRLIGTDLLVSGDRAALARIDRDTGAVVARATIPGGAQGEPIHPYRGGAVVGAGRLRFDARLEVVAENPAAPRPARLFTILHGHRLYSRLVDCERYDSRMQIADADTGRLIRSIDFSALGVLGGGYIDQSNDEDCD